MRIAVIGAGIGGLTVAALLGREGFDVEVLEVHTAPGGCAATFCMQGFRFDAGATLAAGFAPGMPLEILGRTLGISWEARSEPLAMQVHLPDGTVVSRWADRERWRAERQTHFGAAGEEFWAWQERTAEALWALAREGLPWPPQGFREAIDMLRTGAAWLQRHPSMAGVLLRDAVRPVAARLPSEGRLRPFVDAQLLISAQAPADRANALYGAVALDLPHAGVGTLPGGIGTIAEKLTEAVRRAGGAVCFGQEVRRVRGTGQRTAFRVETAAGEVFEADGVIFNVPPGNAVALLGPEAPPALRRLAEPPPDGWGAFALYLGVPTAIVPPDLPLHHQVILENELAEGGMVFISLSPPWDSTRAPPGFRCLTATTHTALSPWWSALAEGREVYAARKAEYTQRMLRAIRALLPELPPAEQLPLWAATPVTFHQFTRRVHGWVGGFPQTSLGRFIGPRVGPRLWLVGDSIFPGPSIPAVVLGAMRVARQVMRTFPIRRRIAQGQRILPYRLGGSIG